MVIKAVATIYVANLRRDNGGSYGYHRDEKHILDLIQAAATIGSHEHATRLFAAFIM